MEIEKTIGSAIFEWLQTLGLTAQQAIWLKLGILLLLMLVLSVVLHFIGRKVMLKAIGVIAKRSKSTFDDELVKHRFFYRLSFILPLIAFYLFDEVIFSDFPILAPVIDGATNLLLLAIIVYAIDAFLNAARENLRHSRLFANKPINSYVQLVKTLIYLFTLVVAISILIGRSPVYMFTALGAVSAVLLLIFKDTILGFTASLQIAANDMVRVGDWVSVEKYGADGDVIEINLVTVKVQNWDKTITTVPTYAFIADSFKNWRGMQDSGGRRIKRSVNINMRSIRFADETLTGKLKNIKLLKPYLEERTREIDDHNEKHNVDKSEMVNGRALTNIGIFRKYAELYIKNHPKVHKDMTYMVRQLQPTEFGLPLEVYCFSVDQEWVKYEGIMGDIFDHLLAVAPRFGIEIFQAPSGSDFQRLIKE